MTSKTLFENLVIYTLFFTTILNLSRSSFANEKDDLDKSEVYLKNKAEIRYLNIGSERTREVLVKGLRISDYDLSLLINDPKLNEKIKAELTSKRIKSSLVTGAGLPGGILLIYLASLSRNDESVKVPNVNGDFVRPPLYDAGTFLLGTVGTIITIYSLANAFQLFNDITGLNPSVVLTDKEAEDIVKKYNQNLINNILNRKDSMNFINNNLSYSNNNIMILDIVKTF